MGLLLKGRFQTAFLRMGLRYHMKSVVIQLISFEYRYSKVGFFNESCL